MSGFHPFGGRVSKHFGDNVGSLFYFVLVVRITFSSHSYSKYRSHLRTFLRSLPLCLNPKTVTKHMVRMAAMKVARKGETANKPALEMQAVVVS